MALYTFTSRDNFAKLNRLPRPDETQLYNAIAGGQATNNGAADDNFFVKRGKSIENAFGTTGAALASGFVDAAHSKGTEDMLKDNKARMEDIAKRYGYNSLDDYYDKIQAAENAGDTATVKQLEDTIGAELKGQAKAGADAIDKRAKDYQDYRENSYIGQKINQDQGKFAGSALNTLSTMTDVMLPAAGIALNTVQGGVEGIADELEQNGFENFDWGRAGQNALIGATTGAVTGAFNKGVSNALAKRGGNLLKGGNKLTAGINRFNANNPVGRIGSTLATGAARGAASGAVGGATGAGLSAAMNGQDVLGSALQGAVQGAQQGATTGGIMAGANMALSKTPGVGNVMRQLNEAGEDWNNRKAQGQDFNQRLTGTLTSGDSAVGEWLQGSRQNKALGALRNMGGTMQDVSEYGMSHRPTRSELYANDLNNSAGRDLEIWGPNDIYEHPEYYTLSGSRQANAETANIIKRLQGVSPDTMVDIYRATPGDSINDGDWVTFSKTYADDHNLSQLDGKGNVIKQTVPLKDVQWAGDDLNEWGYFPQQQTPTTLGGWLKQAGKRVVEDVNNIAPGMVVKDVSGEPLRDRFGNNYTEGAVPVELLRRSQEFQPRTTASGRATSDSVFKNGYNEGQVDQPMLVRKMDDGTYQVLGGHSRTEGLERRAAAGLDNPESVRARVYEGIDDKQALQIAQSANQGGQYESIIDMAKSISDARKAGIKPSVQKQNMVKGYSMDDYENLNNILAGDRNLQDLVFQGAISQEDMLSIARTARQLGFEPERAQNLVRVANERGDFNRKGVEAIMKALSTKEKNAAYDATTQSLFGDEDFTKALDSQDEILQTERNLRKQKTIDNSVERVIDNWDNLDEGQRQRLMETLYPEGAPTPQQALAETSPIQVPISRNIELPENRARDLSGDGMVGLRRNAPMSQDTTIYPEDIRNMKVNYGEPEPTQIEPTTAPQDPATEVYRRMTGEVAEPKDITDAFGDKGLGTIERRNKLQALGQQLQNSAKTQKYAPIYDSLDAKTARRAAETNAPQRLADLGVNPQDYNEYAKTSSYVNRVVSDLAKKSGVKLNVPDLPSRLSADNIDVVMSDPALKKYNGYIKQIVPDGDSPVEYSASYLLEKSRELGDKAANLRGNNDDVNTLRQALTDAKWTLRNLATDALEGSGITGDLTNDNIAVGLKDLGANEAVQDYYTAAVDGKAPSVAEYIRRSSLFEQARDMGNQIDAEKYTRSASKAPTRITTKLLRASGLEQPIETLLRNTVAPLASGITNTAGKAIEGVGNAMAGRSGGGNTPTNTPEVATNTNYNPQTRLYNAIGRTEGLTNAEQARTADYLVNAAQEAEIMPNTSNQTMASPTTNTNTPSTSLYNSVNGNQGMAQTAQPTQTNNGNSLFPVTGDYWTDMLGRALTAAINADDVEAFGQLFGMYQEQMTNLQKQASSSSNNSQKKLTATQQRANAAMNSLNRIQGMNPDLGYNLSQIPVVGDIATLGGNDYESEAKSLAQQIGYMVSGANIKEEEAYNIGKAYVPQPFDNETTRRNKLQRAREIIEQYQSGYAEE